MDLAAAGFTSTLIFFSALMFSSLGLGGSAGYLAIFSLLSIPAAAMSTSVLVINVLVAGMTLHSFIRAGHLPNKHIAPFLVTSVPAAFLGGALHVKDTTYFILLATALLAAAIAVAIAPHQPVSADAGPEYSQPRSPIIPFLSGIVLGLTAGVVGIGGGVLLSPILILLRWDTVKRIAATTALFSLVNSLAGLGGRCFTTAIDVTTVAHLVVAACAGGFIGSHLGARVFSPQILRRILALLLAGVAVRLMVTSSEVSMASVHRVIASARSYLHSSAQIKAHFGIWQ